jgi:hypothetical protein
LKKYESTKTHVTQLSEVKEEDIDLVVILLKTEDNAQLHALFSEIDDQGVRDAVLKLANKALTEAKRFVQLRKLKPVKRVKVK